MPSDNVETRGFLQGLKVQGRVLHALLLREASLRQGQYRLGHLLVLTEVLWTSLVIGLVWYVVGHPPPYGDSIVFYMFTGMFAFTLYRTIHSRVAAALEANRGLLIYPVVRPLDTLLARAALESAFQITAFIIFTTAFIWIGYANFPAHPNELILAIGMTILLGFGIGVTSMIIRSFWSVWAAIDNMLARVLFFVSGIFYQVEFLPPQVREILVWNPLVHAIEWVRYSIYNGYSTQILDREYLFFWAMGSTVFGLAMERLRRPKLLEQP